MGLWEQFAKRLPTHRREQIERISTPDQRVTIAVMAIDEQDVVDIAQSMGLIC